MTAEDGAYEMAEVVSGQRVDLSVCNSAGKNLTRVPRIEELQPGEVRHVDIKVHDTITVQGIVRGRTTGQPLAGLLVVACREAPSEEHFGAETGADGSYLLEITGAAGAYVIRPMGNSSMAGSDRYAQTVTLAAGDTQTLDLTFPESVTRSFQILTDAGLPVEGAEITILEESPNGERVSFGAKLATDTQGRVVLDNLPTDTTITVCFEDPRYLPAASAAIVAGAGIALPEEVIILYERAGLSGVLTDISGQPLAEAEMTLVAAYGDQQEVRLPVRTDEQGFFLIGEKLPATDVALSITRDMGEDVPSLLYETDGVRLEARMITDLGAIALTP
jgi:hypothetical protein